MATVEMQELSLNEKPDEATAEVRALCDAGLFVQAYRASQAFGPLHTWQGTRDSLLAARLALHLAAPTLANWLMRRAYRLDPTDTDARFFKAWQIYRRRGPYWAWRWMNEVGVLDESATADQRACWLALLGLAVGAMRDFSVADSLMQQAIETAPDSAYARLCAVSLLEYEDRVPEALEAALGIVESEPKYVQAVECASHLYTLLDCDKDAIDLLTRASRQFESGSLLAQLHVFQTDLKQFDEAAESLDRWVECSPIPERAAQQWLESRRSELAYFRGDYDAAIRHAEASKINYFTTIAERLRDPARQAAKRTELAVGFVRQNRMTCVPATLAAISRFWSKPADHLQVAEEICYNGTSNYNERRWATRNGWVAREFTVTEESARALVERGVPFTLNTVEPTSAHLQAVLGYDARRGTLLIREPSLRVSVESLADKFLHRYRGFGPRGMAIVPEEHKERFDGIELPDAALWDRIHEMDSALERHCRDEAVRIFQQLSSDAPGHRIAHDARRLAVYDANVAERLQAVESLLEIAPDDPCLQMEQLGCLRGLSKPTERLAVFEKICSAARPHPVFLQQYAEELRIDARRLPEAVRLAERAVRRMALDGESFHTLASVYWDQRRFAEALALYRFAACLNDKDESFARSYFIAAQWFKKSEEAIGFLRARFDRYAAKSYLPARTLVNSLLHLDRTSEAIETIEKALSQRADDAELALFAARTYATLGSQHYARAKDVLKKFEANAPRGEWLRVAAQLAEFEGRRDDALTYWREILSIQPLAVDSHASVATLLSEQEGRAAGLAHLEQTVERFPHYQPLCQLWAQRLGGETAAVREPILRRLIEANQDDGWLHRELGFLLVNQRRADEARKEAETSQHLDPHESATHHLWAALFELEGRKDLAKGALREALLLSIDNTYAANKLLELCDSLAERREVLDFIRDELRRQVIFGDGLHGFRDLAHGTLDSEELVGLLQEALCERPDLWQTWSALAWQFLNLDRLNEAWETISRATDRFPLLPRLWLDRATVARARRDDVGEREALETACQINPKWGEAVRALCFFLERHGELQASRQRLEQLVGFSPLDAGSQLMLAEILWKLGEREAALERVRHIVGIEPGYSRAWEFLNYWANELKRREVAIEAARSLTEQRGAEARSWMIAARAYYREEELDQRLAALDKAVELNPELIEAYDLRARCLATVGRWDEAAAACRPAAFGEKPPSELRSRSAWLAAEQGDRARAIAIMREVVAEVPADYDAWSSLHRWCHETEDAKGSLEAAEVMVRIAPRYEYAYGSLGEAKKLNKDRAGAAFAYRRALEIRPEYEFAANELFDIYIDDKNMKAAAETLAAIEKHSQSAYVLCRAVQLAVEQRNIEKAHASFRKLCLTECESKGPIAWSADIMVKAGWGNDARRIMKEEVNQKAAHSEVANKWARLCAAADDDSFAYWYARQVDQGKPTENGAYNSAVDRAYDAAYNYIDQLVRDNMQLRFSRFLNENRPSLFARAWTWGIAGYAMTVFRAYKRCAAWFADWRERKDAESWMLVNAVEGFWATGKLAEMRAAGEHAISLPDSSAHNLHYLLLAARTLECDYLLTARNWFELVKVDKLDTDYAFIATLLTCVLEIDAADGAKRRAVFKQVRKRIDRARAEYKNYALEPARRKFYRSCLRHAFLLRGGMAAWMWYVGRLMKS